jgi:hypothetical protein
LEHFYNITTMEMKAVKMLIAIPRKEIAEWVTETAAPADSLWVDAVLDAAPLEPPVVGVVPALVVVTEAELVVEAACKGKKEGT